MEVHAAMQFLYSSLLVFDQNRLQQSAQASSLVVGNRMICILWQHGSTQDGQT
jgi:hypothetical protein